MKLNWKELWNIWKNKKDNVLTENQRKELISRINVIFEYSSYDDEEELKTLEDYWLAKECVSAESDYEKGQM